jgi:hypothetical protein
VDRILTVKFHESNVGDGLFEPVKFINWVGHEASKRAPNFDLSTMTYA